MKVYQVYTCDTPFGIFSTREKAEAQIARLEPEEKYRSSWHIDEVVLDAEDE